MKKIISILLSFIISLSMALCGSYNVGATADNTIYIDANNVIESNFQGVGVQWDPTEQSSYTDASWNIITSRLKYMQVPFVRTMYNASFYCIGYDENATPIYDFNSLNMQKLYKILDFCEQNNVTVMIGEWAKPNFAPLYITSSTDPKWLKMVTDCADYLLNTKKYTCIKYFNFINEPNGSWGIDDQGDRWTIWKNGLLSLYNSFSEKGLLSKIKFTGPDSTGQDEWVDKTVNELENKVGAYDIHKYETNANILSGYLEYLVRLKRDFITQNDSKDKPFFITEAGLVDGKDQSNNQTRIRDFEYGVYMADYVAQAIRGGISGVSNWELDDSMHYSPQGTNYEWGFWNSVGTNAETNARPWFYTMSLYSKLFKKGASTLYTTGTGVKSTRVTACKIPNGSKYDVSIALVNNSGLSKTFKVVIPSAIDNVSLKKYNYFETNRPSNPQGIPLVAQTYTNVNLKTGIEITLPSNGTVFLSTIDSATTTSFEGSTSQNMELLYDDFEGYTTTEQLKQSYACSGGGLANLTLDNQDYVSGQSSLKVDYDGSEGWSRFYLNNLNYISDAKNATAIKLSVKGGGINTYSYLALSFEGYPSYVYLNNIHLNYDGWATFTVNFSDFFDNLGNSIPISQIDFSQTRFNIVLIGASSFNIDDISFIMPNTTFQNGEKVARNFENFEHFENSTQLNFNFPVIDGQGSVSVNLINNYSNKAMQIIFDNSESYSKIALNSNLGIQQAENSKGILLNIKGSGLLNDAYFRVIIENGSSTWYCDKSIRFAGYRQIQLDYDKFLDSNNGSTPLLQMDLKSAIFSLVIFNEPCITEIDDISFIVDRKYVQNKVMMDNFEGYNNDAELTASWKTSDNTLNSGITMLDNLSFVDGAKSLKIYAEHWKEPYYYLVYANGGNLIKNTNGLEGFELSVLGDNSENALVILLTDGTNSWNYETSLNWTGYKTLNLQLSQFKNTQNPSLLLSSIDLSTLKLAFYCSFNYNLLKAWATDIRIDAVKYLYSPEIISQNDEINISEKISINSYLQGLNLDLGIFSEFKNKDDITLSSENYIGNGSTIMIIAFGKIKYYKALVKYDANGDGDISILDLTAVKSHLLRVTELDEISKKAVCDNNKLSISCLLSLKKKLLS